MGEPVLYFAVLYVQGSLTAHKAGANELVEVCQARLVLKVDGPGEVRRRDNFGVPIRISLVRGQN